MPVDSTADTGFELSVQQELLWTREPDGPTARSQIWVDLTRPAVEDDLRAALRSVVARHEVLRTVFRRPVGLRLPLQVVLDDLEPAWTVEDLSTVPDGAADLATFTAVDAGAPLDYGVGPLLRGSLLTLPAGRRTLLLTASAAVADARSLAEVGSEIGRLVDGKALGGEPLQYADFAAWQRDQVTARPRQPVPAPSVAGLPFAGSPQPGGTYSPVEVEGSLAGVPLPPGLTVEDAWLAAWLLLAGRLTGEGSVAVGVLDEGRESPELADAVGPYARVVAVSHAADPDAPFTSFAAAVRDARNAFAAAAQPTPPVLPTLPFAFALTATGVLASHPQPFQVRLAVTGEKAAVEYDVAAVGAAEGRRVAVALSRLVADIAPDPERAVGRLEVLPDSERRRLLDDVNRTDAALPSAAGIHELVAEQAARAPDSSAVVAADRTLSYADLDAAANRLAHLLQSRGVTPGTPVALCLERTSALVVAILGVLKAGGAYLPLNPEHPKARLAFQLADSGAPVVLTSVALSDVLPDTAADLIRLDEVVAELGRQPVSAPEVGTDPGAIAYLIYTSGSTGEPKGVAVRHRSLVNYTTAVVRRFHWGAERLRFALVTTVSTDLGHTCLFPSLVSGGTLHLVPVDAAMDGAAYARYANEHSIDVLKITPSHLGALLAVGGADVLPRSRVVLGGEPLSWGLADRVRDLAACTVTNHYGPTETTVGSLVYEDITQLPASSRPSRTVPIGRPLANTRIYVLNGHHAPVPAGAPGELYIGGAGVAAGYWNAPERTAERFVPDPFAGSPGSVMYRTGDLARFLPDGNVEFLGRTDDQVKIRGFRVEPGEVEHVLSTSPRVAQAAVVPVVDPDGDTRLVAYVVGNGDRIDVAGAEELRRWLGERLPAYMVPSAVVSMDSLPLTANGKLDRWALPSPEEARTAGAAGFVPPATDTERQLVAVWSEVLHAEQVGVTDDFFGLGGHSLLATQVIARVRSAFGVQLPLPSLFLAPTVRGLAELVDERLVPTATAEDDLAQMIAEIEGMSEEEAERLLRLEAERFE